MVERWQQLILTQPLNLWSWYEAAKHGIKLEDALKLAKDESMEKIIREGFNEFKQVED